MISVRKARVTVCIEIGPFETTQICKITKTKGSDFEPIFRIEQVPLAIEKQRKIAKVEIDSVKEMILKIAPQ